MDRGEELLLAVLNAASFLFCTTFLAYVLLIVVPFLRRKPVAPGDQGHFAWHFIVPCLDEEAVVGATVKRLLSTFPTAQLWCVDDASTDATPRVLARLARRDQRVHLVARRLPDARHGKGAALNAGWRALRADLSPDVDDSRLIVGVIDADGRLDPRCLDMVAGPSFFGNPGVGAVQVKVRVVASHDQPVGDNSTPRLGRLLVRLQDVEFAGVIAAMQNLRRHVGSVGMGGNGQFTRLSVLETIAEEHGTPWHGALLEDFELGLHVLLSGSRTEYCHDTHVIQEGLAALGQLVRQRSRWAQGSMQCFRYLMPILRSSRISTAGALEIAYFLFLPWLQLIGSVVYLLCAVLVAWYAWTFPGGLAAWLGAGAWGILPLFLCFGLGPLFIWGPIYRATTDHEVGMPKALVLGVANWPYLLVHYLATWWAATRVLRTRHDWKKTARRSAGFRAGSFGLALETVPCVFRLTPSASASASRVVVQGRVRFPDSSIEDA